MSEPSSRNLTRAIPVPATKSSIAHVFPGLKLHLGIQQDESDLCLELKIGPQINTYASEETKNHGLLIQPTQRRSGFTKWQRPCMEDTPLAATQCQMDSFQKLEREDTVTTSELGRLAAYSNEDLEAVSDNLACPNSTALGIPFEFMPQNAASNGMSIQSIGNQTAQLMSNPPPTLPPSSTVNALQSVFPSLAWAENGSLSSSMSFTMPTAQLPDDRSALKMGMSQSFEDKATSEINPTFLRSEMEVEDCGLTMMRLDSFKDHADLDSTKYQGIVKMPLEIPSLQDAMLVEFLRAKKLQKEHFLDKIVVSEDVYQKHPWHYTGGDIRGYLYFCCNTKYSMRGNMTRDRMTREGGRWKQQGMVHPILNVKEQDAALKTYMSYIPCGKNTLKGDFVPNTPGRVKHRHRMIEIALEEDLRLEKLFFRFKVAPKPFLVVCVLKKHNIF